MRTFLAVILLVGLVGCGKAPDPTFDVLKNRFQAEHLRITGKSIDLKMVNIQFGELPEGVSARCHQGLFPSITVTHINFSGLNEASDEMLIFHELGHCVLHRGHTDYKGIMRSERMEQMEYLADREKYLQELFE